MNKEIYKNLPSLFFSKEALKTLDECYTEKEAGNVFRAVGEFFFEGKEPDGLTENEKKGYALVMRYTKAKADEWVEKNRKRMRL